ncbi:MAG: matrixin family metalloprotease [Vicinamibacterales bacterium]|jgi:hypothetical protein|nr:matrixin family metalloprotease [Vicinamibacterales bacterium]
MSRRAWVLAVLTAVVVTGATYSVKAFTFTGLRWPNGSVISLKIKMGAGSGRLIDGKTHWDQTVVASATQWNSTALKGVPIRLTTVRNASGSKKGNDGRNSIFFARTVFGRAFGANTLGVTAPWFFAGNVTSEADIVINSKKNFNSYRGARLIDTTGVGSTPAARGPVDIMRVLIHEIGHLLGLNHPDQVGQRQATIMKSSVSNTDRVLIDDINGMYRLYRVPICRVKAFNAPGARNGNLTNTDCIAPHRPGTKRGDLYSFTGTAGQVHTITMTRGTLADPFLVVLGPNGGKLSQNNNGGGGKNARVRFTAGTTGKYTIEATASANTDRGTYTLRRTVG